MELIDELNAEGATILVITHAPEVAARCPRRITMRDGRIVGDAQPSDVHPQTRSLPC
jgi:putative ABC transport system ATP-binding protein